MPTAICVICGTQSNQERIGDNYEIDCQRCGPYRFTGTAFEMIASLTNQESRDVFSYTIRQMGQQTKRPELDSNVVRWLKENGRLPGAREQANNLILDLGNSLRMGDATTVHFENYRSIVGTHSGDSVRFLIFELAHKGLLSIPAHLLTHAQNVPGTSIPHVTLSLDGWDYFEDLKRNSPQSRKAFMAMQYGDAALNAIVDGTFRPAVKQTGFDLVLLNDPGTERAGLIDDRLRVEILGSRFLIADLTHSNNGAYWEAGFAEGLGKPVIYTCEQSKFDADPPHFDTNHHLTVIWSSANPDGTREKLMAVIRATLPTEAKLD